MEIYLLYGEQKNIKRMINFLLENTNPSIGYRVKKEILQDISKEEEKELQDRFYQRR